MKAIRAGLCVAAMLLLAVPAAAQQPSGKQAAPAQAKVAPAPGGLAALSARIAQIEEQLVDMQVLIGTLESLARSARGRASRPLASPGSGALPGAGLADSGRVQGLETQIRALTFQVEQLRGKIGRLEGAPGRQGALAPGFATQPGAARQATLPPVPSASGGGFRAEVRPSITPGQLAPPGTSSPAPPSQRDAIGGLLRKTPVTPPIAPRSVATQPAANAQQMYDIALNHMLQYDYGAASAAFDDFLKRHPKDVRAPKAQFWLGESYFMRKQYRPAAEAFLKGYQVYARSPRAAHSLLRLAMSLQRLGQKAGACSTFNELRSKYPSAPDTLKQEARAERRKAGC